METEDLEPCSQESSTVPYPEPDQSTPFDLSKIHFIIVTCRVARMTRMTGSSSDDWIY
jgi:hypothetical protein